MLPEALAYLDSLSKVKNQRRFLAHTPGENQQSMKEEAVVELLTLPELSNKIVFPENVVDRFIKFMKTPFSPETKARLNKQRAVLP